MINPSHAPLPAPTTKAELAAQLHLLAEQMRDIGTSMDYYGGLAPWAQYGAQLVYAAEFVSAWGRLVADDAQQRGEVAV